MVFSGIRWTVMSSAELLNTVLKSGFVDLKDMLEVMSGTIESHKIPRRIASNYNLIHKLLIPWLHFVY